MSEFKEQSEYRELFCKEFGHAWYGRGSELFPDTLNPTRKYSDWLEKRLEEAEGEGERFPKIVCLCGSTRFYKQFQEWNYKFTMKGFIVLSVGFYPHAQNEVHGEQVGITPEQKEKLDELHKKKIDLADEIFVINVGGYIGESTRSEIDHAEKTCKPVKYLEPTPGTETPDPEKPLDNK